MSENKMGGKAQRDKKIIAILLILVAALTVAVIVLALFAGGVFNKGGGASQQSSSEISSQSSAASSSSASQSASSSDSSSQSSSASSSSNAIDFPELIETGSDQAYSELSPVITFIRKTSQPGTMGSEDKSAKCAARILDMLYSSHCSPADFEEAGHLYRDESSSADQDTKELINEQLEDTFLTAYRFRDQSTAENAVKKAGIASKCPWDLKTFDRLESLVKGLGFDPGKFSRK